MLSTHKHHMLCSHRKITPAQKKIKLIDTYQGANVRTSNVMGCLNYRQMVLKI